MLRESTGFVARRLDGESISELLQFGCIDILSGVQPVNADAPQVGTLLGRITRNGSVWSPGDPANGLEYVADGRFVVKEPSHLWRLKGTASGTASWFRVKGNASDSNDASQTLVRLDGAIGPLGGVGDFQMQLPNLALTADYLVDITQWWYAVPPISGV